MRAVQVVQRSDRASLGGEGAAVTVPAAVPVPVTVPVAVAVTVAVTVAGASLWSLGDEERMGCLVLDRW